MTPTSPDIIQRNFKTGTINDETDVLCAICKDRLEKESAYLETPCNHIFHSDCLKPWLEMSNKCPNCRKTFD